MTSDMRPEGADPEAYDAAEELDFLEAEDSRNPGDDPNDTGYSPPERPLGMREALTLDQRLAEEEPEEGEPELGGEEGPRDTVGDQRTGRLAAAEGDAEELAAVDVGIDGGAASAEEAAVHTVDPDREAEGEV